MYPPVNIQKALEMECVPKGKAWVLHIYVSLPYTLGYVYIYIYTHGIQQLQNMGLSRVYLRENAALKPGRSLGYSPMFF